MDSNGERMLGTTRHCGIWNTLLARGLRYPASLNNNLYFSSYGRKKEVTTGSKHSNQRFKYRVLHKIDDIPMLKLVQNSILDFKILLRQCRKRNRVLTLYSDLTMAWTPGICWRIGIRLLKEASAFSQRPTPNIQCTHCSYVVKDMIIQHMADNHLSIWLYKWMARCFHNSWAQNYRFVSSDRTVRKFRRTALAMFRRSRNYIISIRG